MNEDNHIYQEEEPTMVAEPAVAYGSYTYTDVMDYLHRICIPREIKESVGRRLVIEATEPDLAKAFARIDHLSLLKNDWDGHGARKVSCHVLNNLRQVLLISDNNDWKYWMISPAPNGSLALQSKRHAASISIGDNDYSYYSLSGSDEEGESHLKFDPSAFLGLMRRIA